jgi:hypothetical protein
MRHPAVRLEASYQTPLIMMRHACRLKIRKPRQVKCYTERVGDRTCKSSSGRWLQPVALGREEGEIVRRAPRKAFSPQSTMDFDEKYELRRRRVSVATLPRGEHRSAVAGQSIAEVLIYAGYHI